MSSVPFLWCGVQRGKGQRHGARAAWKGERDHTGPQTLLLGRKQEACFFGSVGVTHLNVWRGLEDNVCGYHGPREAIGKGGVCGEVERAGPSQDNRPVLPGLLVLQREGALHIYICETCHKIFGKPRAGQMKHTAVHKLPVAPLLWHFHVFSRQRSHSP